MQRMMPKLSGQTTFITGFGRVQVSKSRIPFRFWFCCTTDKLFKHFGNIINWGRMGAWSSTVELPFDMFAFALACPSPSTTTVL